MSEVTPAELVEEFTAEVEDAGVVPQPIDPTLTHEGEAADAKATGDAITAVFSGAKVNEKSFVNKALTLYASDIKMSNETGAQTIAEAFSSIEERDASTIMYDANNLVTVKSVIDDIKDDMETGITNAEIDSIFDEVFEEDDE